MSPINSAANRALEIHEVLSKVFAAMEKADAAVALRVCRFWHEVGIERIWSQLDSIFPLLELISPLKSSKMKTDGGYWAFQRTLDNVDWTRFRRHAEHVKRLEFDVGKRGKDRQGYFSTRFMAELVLQHPFNTALLPRLRALEWLNQHSKTALTVSPFLADSIESLSLEFTMEVDPSTVRQLIRSLGHRAPQITHFSFYSCHPVSEFEEALVEWMDSTCSLREIELPPFYQTSRITSALKKQISLGRIGIFRDVGNKMGKDGMEFSFGKDVFSELGSLGLNMTFDSAAELFRSEFVPAALTEVIFSWSYYNSLDSLRHFLEALASSCGQLESLSLRLQNSNESSEDTGFLTTETIRPLLGCSSLVILEILHNYPFEAKLAQIEEMGRAWPRIRALILCNSPDRRAVEEDGTLGNDFGCLQHYAIAMPSLRYLGLYFRDGWEDCSAKEKPAPYRFGRLETLDVGISRVPNKDPLSVGAFLENLCSGAIPEIQYGEDEWWSSQGMTDQWRTQMEAWKEVKTVVETMRRRREMFKEEYGIA